MITTSLRSLRCAVVATAAFAVLSLSTAALAAETGSSAARSVLATHDARAIAASGVTTLPHNVRPELNANTDLGLVEDSMPVQPMTIVLARTPEQQGELRALIERQHQTTAAEYHQWLTPQQFGQRFGAATADIATVTEWLTAQGFTVDSVLNNNAMIKFHGTAQMVRDSFHTQLHYIQVAGLAADAPRVYANDRDPQVPTALAPVIAGITGLHNIPLRPNHTRAGSASYDAANHVFHRNPTADEAATPVLPEYYAGSGAFYESPQDYYTIYNVNPIFSGGNLGTGNTVAVIEQSDMAYGTVTNNIATGGDVVTFRTLFGVPGTLSMSVYHGYGSVTCTDPGVKTGDEGEATLDAEWANALAPSSTLLYMSCTAGVIESLAAVIDNNLADSMSMSYGSSENNYTSSGYSALDTLYQQAATQGESVFISSGDSGSDVANQNTTGLATAGLNVSAFASSPYVTSSGGTDYQDGYDAGLGGPAQLNYWSITNTGNYSDALSYVPETTWNDSCAGSLIAYYVGGAAPVAFCNSSTATSDGLVAGDIVGGSGGFSTHYATPSYQTGITGYSGTFRAQPDISMLAANGIWGHALLYCDSHTTASNCSSSTDFGIAGGTSFVAPALAGIGGLLDNYTGTRQGVLNYTLYALAKTQFSSSATNTSCYANGQSTNTGITAGPPSSSCIFHDVTTGNISEPCSNAGKNCYSGGSTYGVLSTSTTALAIAYPSTIGYDEATGIGSLNVANLFTKWYTAFGSTTAISSSASSLTNTQSATLTATVTGTQPAGFTGKTPTLAGTITFYSGSTSLGTCTLTSGSCSASYTGAQFGVGSKAVTSTFSGSRTYPTSTSTATTIAVSTSTTTQVTATPGSATYGSSVTLQATVTPAAGTANATGTVSFSSGTTTLGSCTLAANTCSVSTTALTVGTDTVTASYGGATYDLTSSGTTTVTVANTPTTIALVATPSTAAFGASVALKATVTPSTGNATGTVSFVTGSIQLGSCTLVAETCTLNTTALPLGTDTVTASYSGATGYAASNIATSVTITSPATTTTVTTSPTSVAYGATLTLHASVTAASGTPTGTITFSSDGASLTTCTLSSGSCSATVPAVVNPGTYPIVASYGGSSNYSASTSSTAANVTVTTAATTTAFVLTPSSAPSGSSVTFMATVTAASGTPTGTVSFYYTTTNLIGCTLSGGTCSVTVPVNVNVGSYPLTATYSGSTDYAASSGTATEAITESATTTVASASPNPVARPNTVNLQATVARPGGYAGVPTGTVNFYYSTLLLGSATVGSNGVATLPFSTASLTSGGTITISANYVGDGNDTASSGTVSLTIQ